LRTAARRGVRGCLITGSRDPTSQPILALHRVLTEQGLSCRLDDAVSLGHEYSQDSGDRLEAALPFLLGD
jgi:hypothetical protein